MDKKLYKFGMDWLNGVLPVTDVWEVFQTLEKFSSKLRFDRWELCNSGMYNYRCRYCLDGQASLQLMYNPVSYEQAFTACQSLPDTYNLLPDDEKIFYHNNGGVFFSISGDGIRKLHDMGGDVSALNKLMFYFFRNNFKASRFDVYCDILDSENKIVPLVEQAFDNFIRPEYNKPTLRTNMRRNPENISMPKNFDAKGNPYYNCVLGHHGSSVGMFRSYNKYEEVRTGRLSRLDVKGSKSRLKDGQFEMSVAKRLFVDYGVTDYWYRLEYEMHKENAAACFNALMHEADSENHLLCFENIFYSVFDRVFTVIDCSTYNFSQCSVSSLWSAFGSELESSSEYLV